MGRERARGVCTHRSIGPGARGCCCERAAGAARASGAIQSRRAMLCVFKDLPPPQSKTPRHTPPPAGGRGRHGGDAQGAGGGGDGRAGVAAGRYGCLYGDLSSSSIHRPINPSPSQTHNSPQTKPGAAQGRAAAPLGRRAPLGLRRGRQRLPLPHARRGGAFKMPLFPRVTQSHLTDRPQNSLHSSSPSMRRPPAGVTAGTSRRQAAGRPARCATSPATR